MHFSALLLPVCVCILWSVLCQYTKHIYRCLIFSSRIFYYRPTVVCVCKMHHDSLAGEFSYLATTIDIDVCVCVCVCVYMLCTCRVRMSLEVILSN